MKAELEQFNAWRDYLPEFLEDFRSLFPPEDRKRLDFSPSSLDIAEAWILSHFPNTESMVEPAASRLVNLFACYVGEVFRKKLGGEWSIQLKDPKRVFYGLPIVVCRRGDECPITLATAAADRRTGSYIRGVLEAWESQPE